MQVAEMHARLSAGLFIKIGLPLRKFLDKFEAVGSVLQGRFHRPVVLYLFLNGTLRD